MYDGYLPVTYGNRNMLQPQTLAGKSYQVTTFVMASAIYKNE